MSPKSILFPSYQKVRLPLILPIVPLHFYHTVHFYNTPRIVIHPHEPQLHPIFSKFKKVQLINYKG
jgi:hypothetical protein